MRPRPLFAAPHRLPFLVGALQLGGVLAWWSAALLDLSGHGPGLPPSAPAPLLHAPILLFLVLPPFFFGFLLTTFPRWLGFPDAQPPVYLPAGLAFLAAALALWLGLSQIISPGVSAAFVLEGAGWVWSLGAMFRLAILERVAGRPTTWHAWSILVALTIGLGCMGLAGWGIATSNPVRVHVANVIGLDLGIVPVFVTVCHRMIPFFAGNVVKGYVRWRPFWVLSGFWAAAVFGVLGFSLSLTPAAATGKAACAGLTALMAWKWWPRNSAPGLLWVLLIGFIWAPVAFALSALTMLLAPQAGRAPIHLLTIGFALSLVVAMVTRVTQGHSGKPLVVPPIAWFAFGLVEAATVFRLAAVWMGEEIHWLALSAMVLTAGILPWAARAVWIYLRPRSDGKPG